MQRCIHAHVHVWRAASIVRERARLANCKPATHCSYSIVGGRTCLLGLHLNNCFFTVSVQKMNPNRVGKIVRSLNPFLFVWHLEHAPAIVYVRYKRRFAGQTDGAHADSCENFNLAPTCFVDKLAEVQSNSDETQLNPAGIGVGRSR
jgi:hypothetical protein